MNWRVWGIWKYSSTASTRAVQPIWRGLVSEGRWFMVA